MPPIIRSTNRMITERKMGLLRVLRSYNQTFVPF